MISPEVWIWLPREREQNLSPAAVEVLYEGRALARRLGAAPIAFSTVVPTEEEQRWLAQWGISAIRTLPPGSPPHPPAPGGRSVLAAHFHGAGSGSARPRAVIFSADTFGKVTAPLLAAELGAPYIPDASGLTLDGARFVASRATLGDRFEAVTRLDASKPVVITLRPGAVGEQPPIRGSGEGPAGITGESQLLETLPLETIPMGAPPPGWAEGSAPPLLPPDPATLDLEDAERIVAFGRGAFSPQAVQMVGELARCLGAVVAGTRPAADEGWLPFSRQIGLTGAIVRPRLYIAVGISGAPYHMVGIKEPELLIAINNDPEAPIHDQADLSLIGDLREVLPAMIQLLEQGATLEAGMDGAAEIRSTNP